MLNGIVVLKRAALMFHDCPLLADHEYSYHYTFVYRFTRRRTVIYANSSKTHSFYSHRYVPERSLKNVPSSFLRTEVEIKKRTTLVCLIALNFIIFYFILLNILEVRN